jgi:hypothetical protein
MAPVIPCDCMHSRVRHLGAEVEYPICLYTFLAVHATIGSVSELWPDSHFR